MFPKDTNPAHNIFGGVLLSHIDVAGVVAAKKVCTHRFVTVSFKEVEFKKPVKVGDVLTCWVEIRRIGTTSVATHVFVDVERDGQYIPVTEGDVVYVAVDKDDKPLTIESGITAYGRRLRRKLEAQAAAAATAAAANTTAAPAAAATAPETGVSADGSGDGTSDSSRKDAARSKRRRACTGGCS
jgi:acyl-CoA thioesterase YciA